ncbi:hypothetical protein ALT721_480001 [Alteromonas alvinellae]
MTLCLLRNSRQQSVVNKMNWLCRQRLTKYLPIYTGSKAITDYTLVERWIVHLPLTTLGNVLQLFSLSDGNLTCK